MDKIFKVLKCCFKSFSWISLTIIFGLLQIWLLIGANQIIITDPVKIEINKLILDGVFLFFATAIVTTITIDFFFDSKIQLSKNIIGFLFILYPSVILIITTLIFSLFIGKSLKEINIEIIKIGEITILIMTFIYAFIVKLIIFSNEN